MELHIGPYTFSVTPPTTLTDTQRMLLMRHLAELAHEMVLDGYQPFTIAMALQDTAQSR